MATPIQPNADGPVFGEEGFGDVENRRAAQGRPAEKEGDTNPEEAEETAKRAQFEERTSALRQAAQKGAGTEEGEEDEGQEDEENGLSAEDRIRRELIDSFMGKLCLGLPVLGHLLWWNVKMIYGKWIKKGKDKTVGPFTFNDVLLIAAPKAPSGTGTKILSDAVMEQLLILVDLVVAVNVFIILAIVLFPFIVLVYFLTHPAEALSIFGTTLKSLVSSLL